MEEYRQYLAQKILTEDQVVTYRLLSRALKVHVNTAKEMLYDFHKWQNGKRPGTLHATYIIYGTKARPEQQDGDIEMTDSQASYDQASDDIDFPLSDLVPTYTLTLVSQEQLQETLSQYSEVTCIHVYSLAPHPLKDFQLLADTARQVVELSTTDNNTPGSGKVYGTITNPNVRKKERRKGAIPAARAPPSKPIPSGPTAKQSANPSAAVTVKEESKSGSRATSKPLVSGLAKNSAPALKRQGSSGIGQMFAKAAANPKKRTTKASESPATSAAASGAEDNQKTEVMSDDGEDDVDLMADVKREDSEARQSRKGRQAELRRMMEESDAEEEAEEVDKSEEEPAAEEAPKSEPEPEEPAEVVSSASGGRRRGRRRVVRKKQIMDEKGYLVTFQETGWESFSEEEAPPPKANPVKAAPAAKSKKGASKGAAKGAQGSITSFFSKK